MSAIDGGAGIVTGSSANDGGVAAAGPRPDAPSAPAPTTAPALPAPRRHATSLRTRSFLVIAACILIPSLCLSVLGVWAYYRSWSNARTVYSDQAHFRAQELNQELASLSTTPKRLTPAEQALLARAIVYQFSVQEHAAGALLGDLKTVVAPGSLVLPRWAIHSLLRKGYAVGTWLAPTTGPGGTQIVAWRVRPTVGGQPQVYYYTEYWGDVDSQRFQPHPPVDRLVEIGIYGLLLVGLIGVAGAWILSRSVVRPVRRLAEASGRLAEGEAGVTVTPTGPRELRDLAASFNDMNAKLTKAQETEQSFLLSVSHELKTPLTSIRGYAEALDDGALPSSEAAAVIGTESARLERLVGDLLESARMRKSAFTVRRETVDLAVVAEEVARRYDATARDAGLAFHVKLAPNSLATADNDRVLQVVSNLVENAVRCTPAPGSVTVATAPGVVSVADTGCGLSPDDIHHAFERFYLYSRYGHDRPVGTGLGLSIVKELTEAMGGTVRVTSAEGVGTAFFVELPAAEAPAAEPLSAEAPTAELPCAEPSGTEPPLPRPEDLSATSDHAADGDER